MVSTSEFRSPALCDLPILQNPVPLCTWGVKGGSDTTSDSFLTSSAVTHSYQCPRGRGNDCLPFVLWFFLTVRASILIWGLAALGTCMPTSRPQKSFQSCFTKTCHPERLQHQHTGHPLAITLSIPTLPVSLWTQGHPSPRHLPLSGLFWLPSCSRDIPAVNRRVRMR